MRRRWGIIMSSSVVLKNGGGRRVVDVTGGFIGERGGGHVVEMVRGLIGMEEKVHGLSGEYEDEVECCWMSVACIGADDGETVAGDGEEDAVGHAGVYDSEKIGFAFLYNHFEGFYGEEG